MPPEKRRTPGFTNGLDDGNLAADYDMFQSPLGAIRDPEAPFNLDRIAAVALRLGLGIGFALAIYYSVEWWHYYERGDGSLTYLGFLHREWWADARYITSTVLAFWLTFGLARGRRWAFVSLALLAVGELAKAIAYGSAFGIGLLSSELVYATMRLSGSLGAKPSRKADPKGITVRLDRYYAVLALLLSVAADVIYVNSTLGGWHRAQDAGTIAYLPYLAQRWWSRVDYVAEDILVWILTLASFRSQRWAFVVLAFLALGWLFHPIHSGDAFYIWSNAFTLAYCTGRLAWGRFFGKRSSADAASPMSQFETSRSTTGNAEERT